jgi:hypothetical protein
VIVWSRWWEGNGKASTRSVHRLPADSRIAPTKPSGHPAAPWQPLDQRDPWFPRCGRGQPAGDRQSGIGRGATPVRRAPGRAKVAGRGDGAGVTCRTTSSPTSPRPTSTTAPSPSTSTANSPNSTPPVTGHCAGRGSAAPARSRRWPRRPLRNWRTPTSRRGTSLVTSSWCRPFRRTPSVSSRSWSKIVRASGCGSSRTWPRGTVLDVLVGVADLVEGRPAARHLSWAGSVHPIKSA